MIVSNARELVDLYYMACACIVYRCVRCYRITGGCAQTVVYIEDSRAARKTHNYIDYRHMTIKLDVYTQQ